MKKAFDSCRVFQIALRGGGNSPHTGGERLEILLRELFFTVEELHKEHFSIFRGFCDAQINIPYILNIS